MTIIINGEPRTFTDSSLLLKALLATLGLDKRPVAVAKNGEIIPRSEHPTTLIVSGDKIEIVHAVGGG